MNVSRRLPPWISHVRLDGSPRRTVPSLGAASRRPPPSEEIVPASTTTTPLQPPSGPQSPELHRRAAGDPVGLGSGREERALSRGGGDVRQGRRAGAREPQRQAVDHHGRAAGAARQRQRRVAREPVEGAVLDVLHGRAVGRERAHVLGPVVGAEPLEGAPVDLRRVGAAQAEVAAHEQRRPAREPVRGTVGDVADHGPVGRELAHVRGVAVGGVVDLDRRAAAGTVAAAREPQRRAARPAVGAVRLPSLPPWVTAPSAGYWR